MVAALAVAAAALLTVVASGGSRSGGPLAVAGTSETCMPVPDDGAVTWASTPLVNGTGPPIVIDGIVAGPAEGVAVDSLYVAPIIDRLMVGVVHGWVEPPGMTDPGGVELAPGAEWQVVAHVTGGPEGGTVQGVSVSYRYDGRAYTDGGHHRLRLVPAESC